MNALLRLSYREAFADSRLKNRSKKSDNLERHNIRIAKNVSKARKKAVIKESPDILQKI